MGAVAGGEGTEEASESREGLLVRTAPLIAAGESFRWISEGRRRTYAAVLFALVERRKAHEHEVAHDDLYADVCRELAQGAGDAQGEEERWATGYDPLLFRQDVEQLVRWGNVAERVEPTRIRSLADRGRSKLLLRIEGTTARFLDFLASEAEPAPLGLREEGANLLEDVLLGAREARKRLREAQELLAADDPLHPSSATEELLLRCTHLIREADQRTDRIAVEMVEFGELLARFVAEPFRVEALAELTGWLERYVDRYLSALEEKGAAIRRALRALAAPELTAALEAATRCEQERLAASRAATGRAGRLQPMSVILTGLDRFFAVDSGLAVLCRRVNRRTRDLIRRLQRHVESVRLRNVRTEAIRARIGELFRARESKEGLAASREFVNELVAPALCRTDSRAGAPDRRAAPPRPARRYESLRPAFRGAPLEEKRSTPGAAREVERRRLARLTAFIEEHVLRGRDSGNLSEARLRGADDARMVTSAVAAWYLRAGRARPHLGFALQRVERIARVVEAGDFELELRDLEVARKTSR